LTQVIYVQDTSRDINKFVAIGDDAKILYLYKNDIAELTPWNLGINVTPGGPKFNQITYANPMFVAVADTNVIWQSDKGEIWYQARGLSGNDNLNQITFSDGQFKAAGANGDVWYKANPNDVNDLNWVRKKYVQIENDSVGYSIVEVCTLPNYIRDGKQTPQKKCNKTNAVPSLGKSKALPESLQPEGGFKKGDKICVNAMTTSGTDYYFQVNQDATEFNSVTLAVKGTIGNPSADSSDIAAISPIGAPKKGVSYVCASFPN
jgi:hypothetical protein